MESRFSSELSSLVFAPSFVLLWDYPYAMSLRSWAVARLLGSNYSHSSTKCTCIEYVLGIYLVALLGLVLISQMMWSVSLRGTYAELVPLKMRHGYSVQDAVAFLRDIGPTGRAFYIVLESIDLTVYLLGYRAALLIIANNLSAAVVEHYSNMSFLRYSALIVLSLAIADIFETTGQIFLALLYDDGVLDDVKRAARWGHLCTFSAAFNRLKWTLSLAYLISMLVIAGFYATKHLWPKFSDLNDEDELLKKD